MLRASEMAGEPVWPLPIMTSHRNDISDKGGKGQSDIRSTGKGRAAGACTAAAFLENFVHKEDVDNDKEKEEKETTPAEDRNTKRGDVSWCHLDVAGPAMPSGGGGRIPPGASGFGAGLLYQYLTMSE